MTSILLICCAFLSAVIIGEIIFRRAITQTCLGGLIVLNILFAIPTAYYLHNYRGISMVAVGIFWAGGFCLWFSVRCLIESSISLRMLVFLIKEPLGPEKLLSLYINYYGPEKRFKELLEAKLIQYSDNKPVISKKGELILSIIDHLHRGRQY